MRRRKQELKEKSIAIELVAALCVIATVIGGCSQYCLHTEQKAREKRKAKIRQISAEYKNGVSLIEKENNGLQTSFLYLDTDGNLKTTELIMEGQTKTTPMDKCLWRDAQIGDQKTVEKWSNLFNNPAITVVTNRAKERF